jgi:acetyltransferase
MKAGGMLFQNLASGEFDGKLFPVNPRVSDILGHKVYSDIAAIGESVDVAFLVVPREAVVQAVEKCAAAGVSAVCIITAGFSELGDIGSTEQSKLRQIVKRSGIALLGPNTIGFVNARCGVMGSFVGFPRWKGGGISIFAQSGVFSGGLLLDLLSRPTQCPPVGLSVGAGNKVDVDEIDFLHFCADDPETTTIGLYLESIAHPRDFLDVAAKVRKLKPIVLMKSGRTEEGARASSSHTGSQMTDDILLNVGLKQFGIARATDENEFVDALRGLAMWPKLRGRKVAVATTSGALGVISTDLLISEGLELARFTLPTVAKLKQVMPRWVEPANPFDFWVGAELNGTRFAHEHGLEALLADDNVDAFIGIFLAAPMTDFPEFAQLLRKLAKTYEKPLAVVFYGDQSARRWMTELEGARVPIFANTRAAVRSLSLAAIAAR